MRFAVIAWAVVLLVELAYAGKFTFRTVDDQPLGFRTMIFGLRAIELILLAAAVSLCVLHGYSLYPFGLILISFGAAFIVRSLAYSFEIKKLAKLLIDRGSFDVNKAREVAKLTIDMEIKNRHRLG